MLELIENSPDCALENKGNDSAAAIGFLRTHLSGPYQKPVDRSSPCSVWCWLLYSRAREVFAAVGWRPAPAVCPANSEQTALLISLLTRC